MHATTFDPSPVSNIDNPQRILFKCTTYKSSHPATARLNFKEAIAQASGGSARDAPSNSRRHPGQEADFEVQWKVLHVEALSPQACITKRGVGNKGAEMKFRTAVPVQIGTARAAAAPNELGRVPLPPLTTTPMFCIKRLSQTPLHPADIPRVRLFLCHEADVEGAQLPRLHVEVDPCANLSVAIAELKKISRSSAPSKPHSGHRWYAHSLQLFSQYNSFIAAFFHMAAGKNPLTDNHLRDQKGTWAPIGHAVISLFRSVLCTIVCVRRFIESACIVARARVVFTKMMRVWLL